MASAVWTPVGAAAVLPLCDGRIPGAGAGNGLIPINAFLIRSMGRLILVDTGLGDKWLDDEPDLVRADGSVVDGLRRAGVDPLDIHTVINTHLHVDHAGGNTAFDRTRVAIAAFPGANYVIQAAEWAFAASPGDWSALFRTDDFLPLAGTGRLRLVDGPTAITDEVQCVPRPGHTPGHQVVEVVSDGEAAVLAGDAIPSQELFVHPADESAQDVDPRAGAAARVAVTRWASERGAWLGIAHVDDALRRLEPTQPVDGAARA